MSGMTVFDAWCASAGITHHEETPAEMTRLYGAFAAGRDLGAGLRGAEPSLSGAAGGTVEIIIDRLLDRVLAAERERVAQEDTTIALLGEVDRLRREAADAIWRVDRAREALDAAGLRWCEWGTRAEMVSDMLDAALYGDIPDGEA